MLRIPGILAVAMICGATLLRGPSAAAETAPALAFRAFVPGMAADSSTQPDQASLVVATHLGQHLEGGLVITGEVVNGGSAAIAAVKVSVSHSANGAVTMRETESLVKVIEPGSTGPFRVYVPGITDTLGTVTAVVTSMEISSSSAPSAMFTFSGPYPFQIGPPDPKTGVIPYSTTVEELRCAVTNTSDTSYGEMGVVVAAYDGLGRVVMVTTGSELSVPFQQAGQPAVLASGSTASFVAAIPIGLLLTFEGEVTIKGFLNAAAVP